MATSTTTKVTWSTERYDTNSDFASDKFTPQIAGKYLLYANITVNTGLVDQKTVQVYIYKNGTAVARGRYTTSGTQYHTAPVTTVEDANGSTDYFEVYVFHDTGSDEEVYGVQSLTFFCGSKVD